MKPSFAFQRLSLAALLSVMFATPASALLGQCGQPVSNGAKPNTSDALAVLKSAVGGDECDDKVCICDVNSDESILTTDALITLKIAVGQDLQLNCTCPNEPPVADAGPDAAAVVGVGEQLDGSASSDVDGDQLTYQWTIESAPIGSFGLLEDADTATPTLMPDLVGLYTIRLVVSDGSNDSDPDTVTIDAGSPILVTATPSTIVTGDPTPVRVQAQIAPDPDLDTGSVQLFEVNGLFQNTGPALCNLLDNGNLANGDDIAGDNVFACIVNAGADQPTTFRLAVQALVDGTPVRSGFVITAVDPLSEEDAQTIVDVQDEAIEIWIEKSTLLGDTTEARQATVEEIKMLEGVADAGISEDGVTIWIEYESGAKGGLMLNPEGTRSGDLLRRSWEWGAAGLVASYRPEQFERLSPPPYRNGQGGSAGEEIGEVENNNVLIWDAYNSQFAPFDEGPALQTLFQDSPCPKFTVTYLIDGECTIDSVSSFTGFGTVIMVTHGALDDDNQVVFLTRETATIGAVLAHGIDVLLGRVSVMGSVFAIRPSLVSNLAGTFDNSIVYNGSCQSSANNTMANAFLGKGASNYYAFTRVVNSDFAQSVATQLFTNLVTGGMDTTEAFTPVTPKVDPKTPFATFTHKSNETVEYTGRLLNGDFEEGDLTAWTPAGDGRAVTALGSITPTGGGYMGMVSTGLGFTTASGSIQQSFCLSPNASTIEFDWNFNSEEFIEWCFQGFNDTFTVSLVTEAGTSEVLSERIDSLCSSVSVSPLFFDQSGPGCEPEGKGTVGEGGDDCKVWTTGWLHHSFDVSGIAAANEGNGVTLRFAAGDVGDSIFDTAVTIDEISIEEGMAP